MADRTSPRCPLCGKMAEPNYTPFCSRRCADIDLGRWLTGVYRLPDSPADEEADTPTTPPDPA
ncbi:MAG TPA: DNA gyrase inhibitor YacG [Acetobacteraceae bacterium]